MLSMMFEELMKIPTLAKALVLIGLATSLRYVLRLLGGFYRFFLRPGKDLTKLGKWAVVTGATDGIGRAMAFELARKGLNVLLISRTQTKLDKVQEELKEKTKKTIDVETLAIDYSDFNAEKQKKVAEAIDGKNIAVLVNNVGVSYRYPQFFHELTDEEVTALVEMNVNSTTWMTRLVLPSMEKKRRGAIVNIASSSAEHTSPLLAQYSASKAYVVKMSEALNVEYSAKGISVQAQVPFWITTKLAKIRRSSLTVPTPQIYAKAAVRAIGYESVTAAYWVHALMMYIFQNCVPTTLMNSQVLGMHLAIRKRGKKKDEKSKDA